MIISHQHRFIFIKSRKTAGSSIQHALADFCGPSDVISGGGFSQNIDQIGGKNQAHVEAHDLRKMLSPEIWNSYFKFCFIRNPWDLTVSRYFWDVKKERAQEQDFNRWLKSNSSSRLAMDKLTLYSHIGGKPAVDFVGRYEDLIKDFGSICEKLGLQQVDLSHQKARHVEKQHYSHYYNDESMKIVHKLHRESIDCFGYTFERA